MTSAEFLNASVMHQQFICKAYEFNLLTVQQEMKIKENTSLSKIKSY